MKNAIIISGASSSPSDHWFPYIKKHLEKKDYEVWIPRLPLPDYDYDLGVCVPFILKNGRFTKDTIIIGHSSGSSFILSILESISVQIKKAILVSGFLHRGGDRPPQAVKENESLYDWEKIRSHVSDIVFINSVNDPWGCNDREGRSMFDHLGGTLIINSEGHMGSTKFNQPYKVFPLLANLIND
ncbi:alpha/beta hydrolase [Candidatus Gottesmanbacteria bacterium]|nr:alpha/beta hydrolase [Candidatus Gottesmanbacteria bacterium]